MHTLITVIHVCTCVLLILVVLLQAGKGAEISTTLGGSSQTVFGSSGGANFFTRFTAGAATVFMLTSLTLTLLSGQSKKSLFEGLSGTGATATAPVVAASSTPTPVQSKAASQAAEAPDSKK